jgi:hypothetical protein
MSFQDADSIQFSDLAEETIESGSGERVRLGALVTMETVPLSDAITRENQRYTMLVNWEYVGTDRMRRAYIKSILDTMSLPYGYSAEEAQREFFTPEEEEELWLTILLAAVFILMVMAALFESFSLPLLVLSSLPMALFGVVVAYWKTAATFDSSARIGLVLLFGIVVNNAILLVARFRLESKLTLKARLGGDPERAAALFPGTRKTLGGSHLRVLPRRERARLLRRAVARGTLVRLRSVLLTSGTTVVGLLPLLIILERVPWKPGWLFGLELPFTLRWMDTDNQDIWQNLALTSVGGLISSTVLIILALPALYYLCVRMGWGFRRLGLWRSGSVLVAFGLVVAAVLARLVEIDLIASRTVTLGVEVLGRLGESFGPITVGRWMLLCGLAVLAAAALPSLERLPRARPVMAAFEVFMSLLLALFATGAYRSLEGAPRWIFLGLYAALACWSLRAAFEHLRSRERVELAAAGRGY